MPISNRLFGDSIPGLWSSIENLNVSKGINLNTGSYDRWRKKVCQREGKQLSFILRTNIRQETINLDDPAFDSIHVHENVDLGGIAQLARCAIDDSAESNFFPSLFFLSAHLDNFSEKAQGPLSTKDCFLFRCSHSSIHSLHLLENSQVNFIVQISNFLVRTLITRTSSTWVYHTIPYMSYTLKNRAGHFRYFFFFFQ